MSPPASNGRQAPSLYPLVVHLDLRVRYGETDRMGVVYYAHFLSWFEAGRAEYMRAVEFDYRGVEEEMGLFFPVVRASVEYKGNATYDDLVRVSTQVVDASVAKLVFEYRVTRVEDERLLATGATTLVAMSREGKIRRVPTSFLSHLDRVEVDRGAAGG